MTLFEKPQDHVFMYDIRIHNFASDRQVCFIELQCLTPDGFPFSYIHFDIILYINLSSLMNTGALNANFQYLKNECNFFPGFAAFNIPTKIPQQSDVEFQTQTQFGPLFCIHSI